MSGNDRKEENKRKTNHNRHIAVKKVGRDGKGIKEGSAAKHHEEVKEV
jgi:hypothetical protein